jgi:hypothetical protein
MIHTHEQLGIEYLKNIGYGEDEIFLKGFPEDCAYKSECCRPDLITKDGKGWEVKFVNNYVIQITDKQFIYLNHDTEVLIFDTKDEGRLTRRIRFGDLIDIRNYKYNVKVIYSLDMSTAYAVKEVILKNKIKISEENMRTVYHTESPYQNNEEFWKEVKSIDVLQAVKYIKENGSRKTLVRWFDGVKFYMVILDNGRDDTVVIPIGLIDQFAEFVVEGKERLELLRGQEWKYLINENTSGKTDKGWPKTVLYRKDDSGQIVTMSTGFKDKDITKIKEDVRKKLREEYVRD